MVSTGRRNLPFFRTVEESAGGSASNRPLSDPIQITIANAFIALRVFSDVQATLQHFE